MDSKALNSNISGRGLFAQRDFSAGEVVLVFKGQEITLDYANSLYLSGFDYLLQISSKTFLLIKDASRFINHSCEPNSAFLNKAGELIALKPIRFGQEITFDYSANETTEFEMRCMCGSPHCRGLIKPYPKLSAAEKKKLQSIISPFIRATVR